MTMREKIDGFLAQRRLAIIGVSRDEKDFTRGLFAEFIKRGYEAIPVNPHASEIAGLRCYQRMQDVQPPVENALLFTPPAVTDQVVKDCAAAGVKRIWMHRGAGVGAVSKEAIRYCEEQGMEVVAGFCPYMFFKESAFFHRAHGFVLRLVGTYPH